MRPSQPSNQSDVLLRRGYGDTQPIHLAGNEPGKKRRRRSFFGELFRWLMSIVTAVVLAAALIGGSLIGAIYLQARSDQSRPVDAIVVLGAAQYNGTPSPVLRARLDEAIKSYNEGLAPVIVVTGGSQAGDAYTEAEASRDYLIAEGVPEDAILMESKGTNSWESMQNAAKVLKRHNLQSVLLISDGFHLFRVKAMAKELGLQAYGRPAVDSPIRPNSRLELDYVLREAAGVVAFKLRNWL